MMEPTENGFPRCYNNFHASSGLVSVHFIDKVGHALFPFFALYTQKVKWGMTQAGVLLASCRCQALLVRWSAEA